MASETSKTPSISPVSETLEDIRRMLEVRRQAQGIRADIAGIKADITFFKEWLKIRRLYMGGRTSKWLFAPLYRLDSLETPLVRTKTSPHRFCMTLGGPHYSRGPKILPFRHYIGSEKLVITKVTISCVYGAKPDGRTWVFDNQPCNPYESCPSSNYHPDGRLYPTAHDIPDPHPCPKHLEMNPSSGKWVYKPREDDSTVLVFDNLFELWSSIAHLLPVCETEALKAKDDDGGLVSD
jgi:hypothetical protein